MVNSILIGLGIIFLIIILVRFLLPLIILISAFVACISMIPMIAIAKVFQYLKWDDNEEDDGPWNTIKINGKLIKCVICGENASNLINNRASCRKHYKE